MLRTSRTQRMSRTQRRGRTRRTISLIRLQTAQFKEVSPNVSYRANSKKNNVSNQASTMPIQAYSKFDLQMHL